jgi:geranylgeranyl diphosphate synthase type II
MCGGDWQTAAPFAAAVEMIHTYSLIHDDLPCMDNDDFRRGRPTNHKVYGEAIAVLAGDGLLTHAFDTALKGSASLPASQVLAALQTLADAAGVYGMLGGQAIDVENDGHLSNLEALCDMYAMKTGALIKAAGRLGCLAAGAGEKRLRAAEVYTASVGLAFQIRDDLLDLEGDESIGKTTYPRCVGVEAAQQKIDELTETACRAASEFEDSSFLVWLAQKLAGRSI